MSSEASIPPASQATPIPGAPLSQPHAAPSASPLHVAATLLAQLRQGVDHATLLFRQGRLEHHRIAHLEALAAILKLHTPDTHLASQARCLIATVQSLRTLASRPRPAETSHTAHHAPACPHHSAA